MGTYRWVPNQHIHISLEVISFISGERKNFDKSGIEPTERLFFGDIKMSFELIRDIKSDMQYLHRKQGAGGFRRLSRLRPAR